MTPTLRSADYRRKGTVSVSKCADCGRFCNRTYDVPCNPSYLGLDREVCESCAGPLDLT